MLKLENTMNRKRNSSTTKTTVRIFAGIVALSAVGLTGCRYNGNTSGIHWFLDMHDSYAVEAQEEDPTTLHMVKTDGWAKGADSNPAWGGPGSSIRVPPEGTVPRNYQPYKLEQTEIGLSASLKNPVEKTEAVLERGKKQYEIYCAVCHGYTGKGDGPVVPPFPAPPTLVAPYAATRFQPDGMIFHMITVGRGAMKAYAAQIEPADRWAIVHYVRLLQETQGE